MDFQKMVDELTSYVPDFNRDSDGYDYTCGFEDGFNMAVEKMCEIMNHNDNNMK